MRIHNLLPLVLAWCFLSDAEATSLIGAEVPPFVMHEANPLGPGLTAEILLVAAQRLGEPAQLEIKTFCSSAENDGLWSR